MNPSLHKLQIYVFFGLFVCLFFYLSTAFTSTSRSPPTHTCSVSLVQNGNGACYSPVGWGRTSVQCSVVLLHPRSDYVDTMERKEKLEDSKG